MDGLIGLLIILSGPRYRPLRYCSSPRQSSSILFSIISPFFLLFLLLLLLFLLLFLFSFLLFLFFFPLSLLFFSSSPSSLLLFSSFSFFSLLHRAPSPDITFEASTNRRSALGLCIKKCFLRCPYYCRLTQSQEVGRGMLNGKRMLDSRNDAMLMLGDEIYVFGELSTGWTSCNCEI